VSSRAALAGAIALLAIVAPASRADEDIAALRGRLEQIKELVADFEARLQALEAARGSAGAAKPAVLPQAPALPPPAAAPAAIARVPASASEATEPIVPRERWRHVREGLTGEQVTALIGPPTKTFELAGKTVWYYYYPSIGAGSVFFGSRGVASSVQRPAGGSW
jgi:hypothetical protein